MKDVIPADANMFYAGEKEVTTDVCDALYIGVMRITHNDFDVF